VSLAIYLSRGDELYHLNYWLQYSVYGGGKRPVSGQKLSLL
jgi:hypothetical protein